jgi:hypothetical protein
MNEDNEKESGMDETQLGGMNQDSKRSQFLKISMLLRIAGFGALILSFVLIMLWRGGHTQPFFKNIAFFIAGIGIITYITGRILAFLKTGKKNRP